MNRDTGRRPVGVLRRYRDFQKFWKSAVTGGETIILFFCSFYCLSGKIAVSLLPNARLFLPWSKFHSAMVEQNFLRGGTKIYPVAE